MPGAAPVGPAPGPPMAFQSARGAGHDRDLIRRDLGLRERAAWFLDGPGMTAFGLG
jgi:hypothetical protein